MQKKIDLVLKIIVVVWFVLVLSFFIFGMPVNQYISNGNVYTISTVESLFIQILVGIIFFIISLIASPFVFVTIDLVYRLMVQNKIRQNAKFEKDNLNYCREHLNKLSPGIISYLTNFTIEEGKDIAAHILKLLYEGYLEEENSTIKISEKDTSFLTRADMEVLRMVREKDFSNVKDYELEIEREAKEKGLITSNSDAILKFITKFVGGIFLIAAMFIILSVLMSTSLFEILLGKYEIFVFLVFFGFGLAVPIFIIYSMVSSMAAFHSKTSIIRTPKGKKLVKNIYGLEKFLKDFSNLEDASYNEVYTRDYFLIYAVVFGINEKIINEIMQKI